MKKRITHIIILIPVIFIVFSCANLTMPTGGPKDTYPPEIIESSPANYSTGFSDNKISVSFNEYIQLKNATQKLIISPPLDEQPKLMAKGKTLSVQFESDLMDSTTYTLDFFNSVTDLNEGNAESNFQFVFSTGSQIDSFRVKGSVVDAYTLEKQKEIFIELYQNLADTAPLKQKPIFVTKTNDQGEFSIKYLKKGIYKIYALSDVNNNMKFDLPNEKFAFYDSLIVPSMEYRIQQDTSVKDTVRIDTTVIYKPDKIKLFLFTEDRDKQYITSAERNSKYKMSFIFKKPLIDSLANFRLLDFSDNSENSMIIEKTASCDSMTIFLTDSVLYNEDTLGCEMEYLIIDSTGQTIDEKDTFMLAVKQISGKSKIKPEVDTLLLCSYNISEGKILDINKKPEINFSYPILKADPLKIQLFEFQDSVKVLKKFNLINWKGTRKYIVDAEYTAGEKYFIEINKGTFVDYYGHKNDSSAFSFSVQNADQYGKIIINIKHEDNKYFILLMDDKDKIISKWCSDQTKNNKMEIPFLKPANYRLKAVKDDNENRKWDTGNYLKNIQPEKVVKYKEDINVRANWDTELDWNPFGR